MLWLTRQASRLLSDTKHQPCTSHFVLRLEEKGFYYAEGLLLVWKSQKHLMPWPRTRMVQPPSFPPQSPVSFPARARAFLRRSVSAISSRAKMIQMVGRRGNWGLQKGLSVLGVTLACFPALQPKSWLLFSKCPPLTGSFPLSPMLPRSRAERLEWSHCAVEARRSKPVLRGSANRGRNPPPGPGDAGSSHLSL